MASRFFTEGPVPTTTLNLWLHEFRSDLETGGTSTFLGRVRADQISSDGDTVTSIAYTAHEAMAETALASIQQRFLEEEGVHDIRIAHALGTVPAGEAAMIVAVNAEHRRQAFRTVELVVDAVKEEVPIYGKELTRGDSYRWKENSR